jgi:hypothetical protein
MTNDIWEVFLDETIREWVYVYTQYCTNCKKYIQDACLYIPFWKKSFLDRCKPIFTKSFLDKMMQYNDEWTISIWTIEDWNNLINNNKFPLCCRCR